MQSPSAHSATGSEPLPLPPDTTAMLAGICAALQVLRPEQASSMLEQLVQLLSTIWMRHSVKPLDPTLDGVPLDRFLVMVAEAMLHNSAEIRPPRNAMGATPDGFVWIHLPDVGSVMMREEQAARMLARTAPAPRPVPREPSGAATVLRPMMGQPVPAERTTALPDRSVERPPAPRGSAPAVSFECGRRWTCPRRRAPQGNGGRDALGAECARTRALPRFAGTRAGARVQEPPTAAARRCAGVTEIGPSAPFSSAAAQGLTAARQASSAARRPPREAHRSVGTGTGLSVHNDVHFAAT